MAKLSRRSLLVDMAGVAGALRAAPAATLAQVAGGQQTTGKRLNLIFIVVDTLGTHWLGCYGNPNIHTPNLDALAAKSAVFEDAYPEALPTIPVRRSLYTGCRIFPADLVLQPDDQVKIRGWHPLYAEDVTVSETLRTAGYTNGLVTDVYHQFKPGKNFNRGFHSWRYIRGQENDLLESGPRKAIDLSKYLHRSQLGQTDWDVAATALPSVRPAELQYLMNRREWKTEEDWLASRVFHEAGQWLENNKEQQPFYLHVESFSPHEFWDPPEEFYRMYMKSDYRGPRLISPPQTTAQMSPVELEHVRALYSGYVTFVDSRIGMFLKQVELLGLMRNTMIVFVTDHGTMMGEQGQIHKGETRIRTQVTHVPLLVYHPQRPWAGHRIGGFVLHTDVMPTILEVLGAPAPRRVMGQSLTSAIEAGRASHREEIITGWGEHGAVRTPDWCYIGRWSQGPQFQELYDVRRDPDELHDVADSHPVVVKDLLAKLKEHVDSGWALTRGTFATILRGPEG
jgi:arylsulfatase A-like enzyme